MSDGTGDGTGRPKYLHDDLMAEYGRLADTVAAFDQRLLTVKSWGVTASLATVGLGFQQGHYGLFLVAAAGALAFWLIEGTVKAHQLRYYPRMGDIEVFAYELYGVKTANRVASSPLIDWSWDTAVPRVWGQQPEWLARFGWARRSADCPKLDPGVPQRRADVNPEPGTSNLILLWPHVALPHAITAALGLVLFVLGLAGYFGPI